MRLHLLYRRADAIAVAGRIYDYLVSRYGHDAIFMDQSNIGADTDFREQVRDAVRDSDLILAIVGNNWLGDGGTGAAAIWNEMDPIRIELEEALRSKKEIIPILVDGARMPAAAALPDSVKNFAFHNALVVRSGVDFRSHLDRLTDVIDTILKMREHARSLKRGETQGAPPRSRSEAIVVPPPAASESAPSPAKIIISYRRADSEAITGRLFDRLVARFGRSAVYMDIDSIPYGSNFRTHVEQAFEQCQVLIAVIGPRWLGRGWWSTRIFKDNDPVRIEIQTALRKQVPIIPVLLDGATMPDSARLPGELNAFSFSSINAARLSAGQDFDQHAERIIRSVDDFVRRP